VFAILAFFSNAFGIIIAIGAIVTAILGLFSGWMKNVQGLLIISNI
jgi:hypothetical protein